MKKSHLVRSFWYSLQHIVSNWLVVVFISHLAPCLSHLDTICHDCSFIGQLEQIFNVLVVFSQFDLHILNSSVDVEDCLKSMECGSILARRKRKVLLASGVADSSITIPNVTCVIDTCRALDVKWNVRRSQPDVATV